MKEDCSTIIHRLTKPWGGSARYLFRSTFHLDASRNLSQKNLPTQVPLLPKDPAFRSTHELNKIWLGITLMPPSARPLRKGIIVTYGGLMRNLSLRRYKPPTGPVCTKVIICV